MRLRPRIDPLHAVPALVFASFLAYYGLCCFRSTWGGDFQMYCAGIAQLYRDLLHPGHEAMNVPGAQSTVYTPYLVALGAVGRLAGLTPYRALQLAGVVNLVVYLWGIHFLLARWSMHRRTGLASACFLLVTLFLRWHHFGWSSETSALSMMAVQAYPSTLGWALAFFVLGLTEDLARERRRRTAFALVLLLALLLCNHVLTASWVIGMMGLRGLYGFARDRDWRFPVFLGAAIAAAVAAATLWPYSPFFGQSGLADTREPSRFGERPFTDFANLYLVALPCAAWLLLRARRHLFAAIGFLATLAALEVWRRLGISFGNRYSFFMAFWAQLVVAEAATAGILALLGALELPALAAAGRRWWPGWLERPAPVLLLLAAALAWLPSPMWRVDSRKGPAALLSPAQLWRRPSPHDRYYTQFGGLAGHVGEGDVVMMPVNRSSFDLASVTGAKVVSAPNALRVPGFKAREHDVWFMLTAECAPHERLAILRKYCASKVLLDASFERLGLFMQALGAPIYRNDAVVLFDAAPELGPECRPSRS